MSKKLEQLTPAQTEQLAVYRDKWLAIGLATEDHSVSDSELRSLVDAIYAAGGLAAPGQIIRVKSPKAMQEEAQRLVGKKGWVNTCYGNQDAGWLSFYDYFSEVCGLDLQTIRPLIEMSKRVGWFVPLDGACIVSDRPTALHRNSRGALHCTTGPAVEYGDGYSVFALNGVRFDTALATEFITKPRAKVDRKAVLGIKNVEQRGEVIKMLGVTNFLSDLKPRTLDTYEQYSLLSVTVGPFERTYLKMQNPSVDEVHIEAVHPDCRSVQQALQWRNFGEVVAEYTPPQVLT
jgi:hypothetical protein